MTRALFGTDGIRGKANTHPMTPEIAMRLGMAAGTRFRSDSDRGFRLVFGIVWILCCLLFFSWL